MRLADDHSEVNHHSHHGFHPWCPETFERATCQFLIA
jgi:hypothetical protein